MGYPRFQRARAFKTVRYTAAPAGSWVTTSTAFVALDTALDLTLEAQAGDVLEASINAFSGPNDVVICMDAATVVSNAVVNYFSSTSSTSSTGFGAWHMRTAYATAGGSAFYTVTAADISAGLVTVRVMWRLETASSRSIQGSPTTPFFWAVKNLGPADPN